MIEALWLCTTNPVVAAPNRETINGIVAMVINADDAQSAAQTIAEAVARAQAQGHQVPADYFSSAVIISNLTSGPIPDDTDAYIIGSYGVETALAP